MSSMGNELKHTMHLFKQIRIIKNRMDPSEKKIHLELIEQP